jgi:cytochrome P450
MHDPDVYDNPMEFDPMRWLIETPEGLKANPDIMIPEPTMPFGFGRRSVLFLVLF